MPTWLQPRAPPPPSTRPTEQPRSILASREKSEWTSGLIFSTRSLVKCSLSRLGIIDQ